jgi:predicted ATPase
MLNRLSIHGFRTLVDTEINFAPLTIMIGKNGVGKTSVLDFLQILGNFARGGVDRAFGSPPWSLGWQRTRGIGKIHAIRCDAELTIEQEKYKYSLSLDERDQEPRVVEERLLKLPEHSTIASFDFRHPPAGGSILSPQDRGAANPNIASVSKAFQSVISYELNPAKIEQGNESEQDFISRDGFGVAAFLANLKDSSPERFTRLEERLRKFRPETEAIDVWSGGAFLFWGLRDKGQHRAIPAVHASWGDRQLVGLLCVLEKTDPGATIAIEEIDRGFHPSRYAEVIELLTEAAYEGLDGRKPAQIVITTHSPSFLSKLGDRINEIRLVTRVPSGGTLIRSMDQVLKERLGTDQVEELGDVWEMGLLDAVNEAIT